VLYPHSAEQAEKFSQQTLDRLKAYKLLPTPHNYELWYAYVSGELPEVVRAINFVLEETDKVTQAQCTEIYNRFLSDDHAEAHVRKAGDELQFTIKSVKDAVRDVHSVAHDYDDALNRINQALDAAPDGEKLQEVVTLAKENTKHVMKHNKTLEVALEKSTVEIERLRHDLEQVKKESLTDSLTGISNRKAFDAEIQREIRDAIEDGSTFSLLMLDIDHFKEFNDTYGHQVGDQVLRLVGKSLTDGIKGRDFAARYGGEEFVIILPETELTHAVAVANNLRKHVSAKEIINRNSGDKLGRITLSVGVTEFSGDETAEEVIERADSALYTAKHGGRNQVAAAQTTGSITNEGDDEVAVRPAS
jgi:diguanylate cyclase